MKPKSWLHTGLLSPSHMSESFVQMFHELQQSQCHDHCPGKPVTVPNNPLGEEPFLNTMRDPPLIEFHAVPSGLITAYQKEEISACPSAVH